MTWILVLYIYSGGGFIGDTMGGYRPPPTRVEVFMPSRDVCEEIAKLTLSGAECWAKPIKSMDKP